MNCEVNLLKTNCFLFLLIDQQLKVSVLLYLVSITSEELLRCCNQDDMATAILKGRWKWIMVKEKLSMAKLKKHRNQTVFHSFSKGYICNILSTSLTEK